MKNLYLLLLVVLISLSVYGQEETSDLGLVPEPVKVTKKSGHFTLPEEVTISAPENAELGTPLKTLKDYLSIPTGSKVKVQKKQSSKATIKFQLNSKANSTLGHEGYELSVNTDQITIKANTPAGLYYGVQSLVQLFPAEIEKKEAVEGIEWKIPVVDIEDYPRFGWRGLMFDVSRHFFTVEEVKQFIDDMVLYKYNILHLHLTDDQGWRIEIKGRPKLTEIGAWNVKKEGYFGTFSDPKPDVKRDYGGYFTQDDIKEIVQYAKDRFVDILPEVDVPGHSLAAVAAYPELSCTDEAKDYQVNSGEPFMDWSHGAPPIALKDNTLCPANEKVYDFLDEIVSQLAELFPFEYIHMGGDEAPHNYWEKEPQIKKLMKKEGLKDMNEVQSYFTKRVEKIVESKGKKLIGWDEILEGGLAPNAAVMSWRGMEGGKKAAKMGHEVVMSPTDYAYIDYMQGDVAMEPKVYATLLLNKSYEFEPIPEGVDSKYIKGGQANLWTEQIYNLRYAQYMTWPRGLAIAEALWSPKEKRDWKSFVNRLEMQFDRFDSRKTNYAPSVYEPMLQVKKDDEGNVRIDMETEIEGLDLHYSFDNSFPDEFYPKYEETLTVPVDAVMFRVISYKEGKQVGRMISVPVEKLEERLEE